MIISLIFDRFEANYTERRHRKYTRNTKQPQLPNRVSMPYNVTRMALETKLLNYTITPNLMQITSVEYRISQMGTSLCTMYSRMHDAMMRGSVQMLTQEIKYSTHSGLVRFI